MNLFNYRLTVAGGSSECRGVLGVQQRERLGRAGTGTWGERRRHGRSQAGVDRARRRVGVGVCAVSGIWIQGSAVVRDKRNEKEGERDLNQSKTCARNKLTMHTPCTLNFDK